MLGSRPPACLLGLCAGGSRPRKDRAGPSCPCRPPARSGPCTLLSRRVSSGWGAQAESRRGSSRPLFASADVAVVWLLLRLGVGVGGGALRLPPAGRDRERRAGSRRLGRDRAAGRLDRVSGLEAQRPGRSRLRRIGADQVRRARRGTRLRPTRRHPVSRGLRARGLESLAERIGRRRLPDRRPGANTRRAGSSTRSCTPPPSAQSPRWRSRIEPSRRFSNGRQATGILRGLSRCFRTSIRRSSRGRRSPSCSSSSLFAIASRVRDPLRRDVRLDRGAPPDLSDAPSLVPALGPSLRGARP